jgi:PhoH-like ATPase
LPGTEKEKIAPLMRPILDNLETLVDSDKKHRYDNEEELADKVQELFERKLIDTQAVGLMKCCAVVCGR